MYILCPWCASDSCNNCAFSYSLKLGTIILWGDTDLFRLAHKVKLKSVHDAIYSVYSIVGEILDAFIPVLIYAGRSTCSILHKLKYNTT